MEPSSIESRTRASFGRVKRDIDALKRQIARLRERDEKLDHALSDYARTGELYERIRTVDERFAALPDSYPTAEEFERAIERLVKEVAGITKRLKDVERRDLAPEVSALRRDLDALDRRFVPKADYDAFSDKASRRVAKLDDSVGKLETRGKRLDAIEKRLDALKGVGDASTQLKEHAKAIKKLDGLDAKTIAKRLDALEKDRAAAPPKDKDLDKRLAKLEQRLEGFDAKALDARMGELGSSGLSVEAVRAEIEAQLSDVVRVTELNGKIDEFNVALESVADADRLAQIEASLAELRESSASAAGSSVEERLDALESRLGSERHATNAEVTTLSDRFDTFASRLAQIEESLGSERHATNAEVTTVSERLEELSSRLDRAEVSIENAGSGSGSDDLARVRERLDEIEAQNSAVLAELGEQQTGFDARFIEDLARDLGVLKARVEEIAESVNAVLKSASKSGAASAEHLADEIEFLRSNVAMQGDLDALRDEIGKSAKKPSSKGAAKGDARVEVLSDDLQRLVERQSELEKKVVNLETQNRASRSTAPQDPLWNGSSTQKPGKGSAEPDAKAKAEEKRATIAEKVPLREAKKKPEPSEPEAKKSGSSEPEKHERPREAKKSAGERKGKGPMGRVRGWVVDFFTEEVEDDDKDELY